MDKFARNSQQLQQNIDSIKESVETVNIAVEESAKGVVNVAEMSIDLSGRMEGVGNKAHENMDISMELKNEVDKFKI